MSKKDVTASQGGPDEAEADSVFDFLYHDSRRIASFLSQFDENGLLTGLTQGEGVTKGARRGKRIGIGAQAPILGGGNLEFEIGPGEAGSQTMERVYDPFWTHARLFLDVLTERNMIQRDITSARMGQFVLITGSLIVADMAPFRDLWKSDLVKRYIIESTKSDDDELPAEQNRQQKRRAERGKAVPAAPTEADLVLEMLPYLPHSSHIHIVTSEYAAWGTADADNLTGSFADLALKHGAKIAGEWSALGILDGMPFETEQLISPLEQVRVGMTTENIAKLPLELAPHIRQLLGRPLLSYGITPLLIFREVS